MSDPDADLRAELADMTDGELRYAFIMLVEELERRGLTRVLVDNPTYRKAEAN